eukprot:2064592-Rhodomonas_salina.1
MVARHRRTPLEGDRLALQHALTVRARRGAGVVRDVPPEARADHLQLGGQVDPRLGHVEARRRADLPPRAGSLLDPRRPP